MIPTKDQCDQIVAANDSFYRKDLVVDGVNVAVYNYRLAGYQDFFNPLGAQEHTVQAFELRGLTFVEQADGSWLHWLSLSKFFNVGETTGWLHEDLRPKRILSMYEKLDGSLITFVYIKGKWRAKTKQMFENEQAQRANEILAKDAKLQVFLQAMANAGLQPFFEYTAPDNRIVLFYPEPQLTLIQVRCLWSGAYFSLENYRKYGMPIAKEYCAGHTPTFDFMLSHCEYTKGVEGWIANFDGQLAKFKTKWYFDQHRARESLGRSDSVLLDLVLSNNFDDAIAMLGPEEAEQKAHLEAEAQKIRNYYNSQQAQLEHIAKSWFKTQGEPKARRKNFYLQNKDFPYIGLVMSVIDNKQPDLAGAIKQRCSKTNLLEEILA